MNLLTMRPTGQAADFLNCLSQDLGFVQLVPLGDCFHKIGILELVYVGCRYNETPRVFGC